MGLSHYRYNTTHQLYHSTQRGFARWFVQNTRTIYLGVSLNMKQLIRHSGPGLIVGLDDVVVLIVGTTTTILEIAGESNDDLGLVQAVDIRHDPTGSDVLHCAVARRNKSLAIYKIHAPKKQEETQDPTASKNPVVHPHTVHSTEKRVTSVCFALVEGADEPLLVLIAADVVGDATAWSTTTAGQSTLLVGHTASMLTAVKATATALYTADRDEKIRISSFPNTYIVNGYLLGHTAYVTDFVLLEKEGCVVSIGGDHTVRFWRDTKLLDTLALEEGTIPVKIAALNASNVAVLSDGLPQVQVYRLCESDTIHLGATYDLLSQPLGLVVAHGFLYVLIQKKPYLQVFRVDTSDETEVVLVPVKHAPVPQQLVATVGDQDLSSNLLEHDNNGNILLSKCNDQRAIADRPWMKIGRTEKNRLREKRRRSLHKRRSKRRQGEPAQEAASSVEDEQEQGNGN